VSGTDDSENVELFYLFALNDGYLNRPVWHLAIDQAPSHGQGVKSSAIQQLPNLYNPTSSPLPVPLPLNFPP
jgi:hypothetical protein